MARNISTHDIQHLLLCLSSVNVSKHFFFASLFLTLSSDHTTPSWSMQQFCYFSHAKNF